VAAAAARGARLFRQSPTRSVSTDDPSRPLPAHAQGLWPEWSLVLGRYRSLCSAARFPNKAHPQPARWSRLSVKQAAAKNDKGSKGPLGLKSASKYLSSIDDAVQGVREEQAGQLKAAAGQARSELAITEPPSKWKVISPAAATKPGEVSQDGASELREHKLRKSAWKDPAAEAGGNDGSLSSASSTSSAGIDSRSVYKLMEAAEKKKGKITKKHDALASMQAARQRSSEQVWRLTKQHCSMYEWTTSTH
jgi:hypothetical protein